MTRRKLILATSIPIVLALSIFLGLSLLRPQLATVHAPTSVQIQPLQASLLAEVKADIPSVKEIAVDSVKTSGAWSLVTMHPITGQEGGTHGVLAIGHYDDGGWMFAIQGEQLFWTWLDKVPSDLLTNEAKDYLR